MIDWPQVAVYLHREPVDFRKAINGSSVIVEEGMGLSPFEPGLFVFCNKRRDKLKVLYWDRTGFCLWQKRLERERFLWPRRHVDEVVLFTPEQFAWLLRGLDVGRLQPHASLHFGSTL